MVKPDYDAHVLLRDFLRAREVAPYADERLVADTTARVLAAGHTLLETHKLAASDQDHVARLLDFFDPPRGARVLDAGCGVGSVAAWMHKMRPDLDFVLLNISRMQLKLMEHPKFAKVAADFHALPFADRSFDAAMYIYCLGHGLLDRCLEEAARVLRPAGVLFIYDISSLEPATLIERMGYRPHRGAEVLYAARRHGLHVELYQQPLSSISDFIELVGEHTAYAFGIHHVSPVVSRFVKENHA